MFYYDEDYKNSVEEIIFHRGNNPGGMCTIMPKKEFNITSRYTYDVESIKVEKGMLILFPSSQTHSVAPNTSNKDRKSLAFNVVPTDGFGTEIELTELKF